MMEEFLETIAIPCDICGDVKCDGFCDDRGKATKEEVDKRGGGRQARQSSDPNRMGRYQEGARDL